MTDKTHVVALALGALCFVGFLIAAIVAMFLGRELRVEGRVKLSKAPDVAASVAVQGATGKSGP